MVEVRIPGVIEYVKIRKATKDQTWNMCSDAVDIDCRRKNVQLIACRDIVCFYRGVSVKFVRRWNFIAEPSAPYELLCTPINATSSTIFSNHSGSRNCVVTNVAETSCNRPYRYWLDPVSAVDRYRCASKVQQLPWKNQANTQSTSSRVSVRRVSVFAL